MRLMFVFRILSFINEQLLVKMSKYKKKKLVSFKNTERYYKIFKSIIF